MKFVKFLLPMGRGSQCKYEFTRIYFSRFVHKNIVFATPHPRKKTVLSIYMVKNFQYDSIQTRSQVVKFKISEDPLIQLQSYENDFVIMTLKMHSKSTRKIFLYWKDIFF